MVRSKAANAMGDLMVHNKRVDPLVTELLNGVRTKPEPEIKASMFDAITCMLANKYDTAQAYVQRLEVAQLLCAWHDIREVASSVTVGAAVRATCTEFLSADIGTVDAFSRPTHCIV